MDYIPPPPTKHVVSAEGTKPCARCGAVKPITEFNKSVKQKCGYRKSCRDCDKAWSKGAEVKPTAAAEPMSMPKGAPEAKVIGRIGPTIQEVAIDPFEADEREAAKEYSALLNRKLSVRQRANLMVKIAKNVKGGNAALALKAIQDINLATGIISKSGAQTDLGPLFVLPGNDDVGVK